MDNLAKSVIDTYIKSGRTIATAESCTGGMLGALLTDISGCSAVYIGGIISYANEVKQRQVGVPLELLEVHGAVSEPVARAMALGVKAALKTHVGVGITGIAGPNGDSSEKPVGLVFVAVSDGTSTICEKHHLSGDRKMVREKACDIALLLLNKI